MRPTRSVDVLVTCRQRVPRVQIFQPDTLRSTRSPLIVVVVHRRRTVLIHGSRVIISPSPVIDAVPSTFAVITAHSVNDAVASFHPANVHGRAAIDVQQR